MNLKVPTWSRSEWMGAALILLALVVVVAIAVWIW